ncbi:5-oxoprolinase/urea amidolyase family protein [Rhizobiaceae bacterium n13]|uniref:5-oxoprolinase/urea amidolyase family protein n=1 Tax=Ferirhizobium litorale TaxID=2927786 RepID=A0AAE3U3B6_9HYPH|nr:urea amidolyase family protein [Fererhizobium litorale]MDI7861849.1 5-oxoprolinase/urea amidolyase family protein [Fererhizobium litorale]MDI7921809.1 5-oxoprolinase/urea amidolyase family protein [Fererhizobium litorale]
MRFLPVSLTTILVELADLDETLALFASLQVEPVKGIEEMVPAARTLMIRFRPEVLTPEELASNLSGRDLTARAAPSDTVVEIPVSYDGEDLEEVARLVDLSPEEVVRRHTESEFTVAFCGFAPGFGYLVGGDPTLHVPRRQSPRTRIPAGSVALAGAFSGVYPQASPGGWQIIGTTPLKMWDLSREPAALFQPGYRVRFFDVTKRGMSTPVVATADETPVAADGAGEGPSPAFKVLAAPMPALFQDLGRPGQAGQGVSASGALDRGSLVAANRTVGNSADQPCLEITLGGLSFECLERSVVALTGAPCPITVRDRGGVSFAAEVYQPIPLEAGDTVTLGAPPVGMRTYLAVRGGFDVRPVLGSASTDTLAVVGPEPVTAGAKLGIKIPGKGTESVSLTETPPQPLPAAGDIVTLDVVMGPRTDWFTEAAIQRLTEQLWLVTPQSSRVGIRLSGETPLEKLDTTELPSEGTATGAIQVPHSGQPVLFLADHPLTGGYPVIATVAEYHLDLAGQVPVNARIRFRPVTRFGEISPARG